MSARILVCSWTRLLQFTNNVVAERYIFYFVAILCLCWLCFWASCCIVTPAIKPGCCRKPETRGQTGWQCSEHNLQIPARKSPGCQSKPVNSLLRRVHKFTLQVELRMFENETMGTPSACVLELVVQVESPTTWLTLPLSPAGYRRRKKENNGLGWSSMGPRCTCMGRNWCGGSA